MTPDEARDLLDNFDRLLPFEAELELEGAAKDMARTIAGMREEWGLSYRLDYENEKRTMWGWETRDSAKRSMRQMDSAYVYGIVRRYVTNEEEIE